MSGNCQVCGDRGKKESMNKGGKENEHVVCGRTTHTLALTSLYSSWNCGGSKGGRSQVEFGLSPAGGGKPCIHQQIRTEHPLCARCWSRCQGCHAEQYRLGSLVSCWGRQTVIQVKQIVCEIVTHSVGEKAKRSIEKVESCDFK